jgi:hypothetical protein
MQPVTIFIGQVQSSTRRGVAYCITRVGKPKAEGGNGVTWCCECFWNQSGKAPPCRHLRALWSGDRRHATLTEEGIALLSSRPRSVDGPGGCDVCQY